MHTLEVHEKKEGLSLEDEKEEKMEADPSSEWLT